MSVSDEQLRYLFDAVDTDNSGYLCKKELRELCAKFSIVAEDADAIFDDLDVDGDDQISFDDFRNGFDDYEKSVLAANAPLSPDAVKKAESFENILKGLEEGSNGYEFKSLSNDNLNDDTVFVEPLVKPLAKSRKEKSADGKKSRLVPFSGFRFDLLTRITLSYAVTFISR